MQPSADPPASSASFSPSTSSSVPLSRTTSLSSQTDITIEPSYSSGPAYAQDSLSIMRDSLINLEVLDFMVMLIFCGSERLTRFPECSSELESQAMDQGLLNNNQFGEELQKIRQGLDDIDKGQTNGIQEIHRKYPGPECLWNAQFVVVIMEDMLKHKALDVIRKQVDDEIKDKLGLLIQEEVQEYLKQEMPSKLGKDLQKMNTELDELHRDLHNSESKRMNSFLREKNPHEPLQTICKSDGKVSEYFPKTLDELFNLDDKACKALVQDYGLEVSSSKDGNLNRFMVFAGVQYQMVRRGNNSKHVAFDIPGA
ncbi:hypothetical protein D9757_014108 [Collybiopsis confluens]|uniref:Uncharacterized protein n=1 Tax=Collybiopsis confluens TaxID=2823264 RepID=A0A8H5CLC8_9AGAR|nr:hypothetical protein D9757_014108 [Collybiopsis confluens]